VYAATSEGTHARRTTKLDAIVRDILPTGPAPGRLAPSPDHPRTSLSHLNGDDVFYASDEQIMRDRSSTPARHCPRAKRRGAHLRRRVLFVAGTQLGPLHNRK